ncbi:MAG: hypothetical protein B1H13_07445, partial [Desulfobacteraceae bacterium 4484_190.3]
LGSDSGKRGVLMRDPWFFLALVFDLFATGGYIVYLVKQEKWVSRSSCVLLFAGFIFHTVFLCKQYVVLGTAPVLDLKMALSFFSWCIILVFLVFHLKFRIMVLGSFVAPFAAFLMIISSAMPLAAGPVKPIFKSIWLTVHVTTIFLGNGLFAITFVVAVMYLIQEHQIKQKRFGSFYTRLPSLATLDNINHYALLSRHPRQHQPLCAYLRISFSDTRDDHRFHLCPSCTGLLLAMGPERGLVSILCFCILLFTFLGASLWAKGYHSFSTMGTGGA